MNPEITNNLAREGGGGMSPFGLPSASGATNTGRGAIVALLRVGTRKARLAAALMLVVTGLVTQTANQALAEARQAVLYLDAPAVSKDRAANAGEVARAYSDPRSPTSADVLAWLGVRSAAENDTGTPSGTTPQNAAAAFASVTALDAKGTPAVTAEAAYEAGETMLAQIEDGAPSEGGSPSEDDLAAAGGAAGNAHGESVRPKLGEGKQAPDKKPAKSYEAPPAEQPSSPDVASSPEPVAGPDGAEGLALQAPAETSSSGSARTEFAAAPSEDASPTRGSSPGDGMGYGATGPVSETAAGPSDGPDDETEAQEPELQKEEVREPSRGRELAGVEHAPANGTGQGGEAAHADPAGRPEPASEVTYQEPSPSPDTGPTSAPSDDLAPMSTSSPPLANDATTDESSTDEPASTNAAPGGSGEDGDPGQDASGGLVTEVVIVQGSQTGEGDDASAAPEESTPPADDAEAAPGDPTETPTDVESPQEEPTLEPESEPQPNDQVSLPTGEPSDEPPMAEDPTAHEGAPTASPPPDSPADAQEDDGSAGASETTAPSPTSEPGGDPDEAPADRTVDESVGDQQVATPTEETAMPAPDERAVAQDTTQSPTDTEPGNESSPPPTAEPEGEGQAPRAEVPERPSRDLWDDRPSLRDRSDSDTPIPDERIERVEHGNGDDEVAQETTISASGGERRSVTEFRDEGSSGGNAPEFPAATALREDEGSAPRKSAQDDPQNVLGNHGLDLDVSGPTGSSRAGKESTARKGRSRNTGDSTPDEVDEESSEGSQPTNLPIRNVDPKGVARISGEARMERRAETQMAARRVARQQRIVCRQQIAAEEVAAIRRGDRIADRIADRRVERRETRRAKPFAARVAQKQAERKANRIAAVRAEPGSVRKQAAEQAAAELATIRRQRRPASTAATLIRNTPAQARPIARPERTVLTPVRQVRRPEEGHTRPAREG